MTYTRIEKAHPALLAILFLFIGSDIVSENNLLDAILWILMVVLVMSLGMKFQLHVKDDKLDYRVFFLSFRLYKRTIAAGQIQSVIFKRTDWTKKKAVIKIKSGMNIKVIENEPTQIFAKLDGFASAHDVQIKKSKDYMLLEKYY
ncbi:hypothetical protein D3H55_04245 [Bacillus salacetis]|uniref:Uncharacterized protein n=1 Tax=Bacillus salacetis TaxID=2315464 RepID=A0A3A1R8J1_9BACI|nr:hypothetical protein [Bacillus salacetis]RIW37260.1 hypothetical protein D3H55_04245 [Bacillus salacetis]